ncbi:MAG: copper homeostasis membrane protein CopD [Sphingomicrobium sp.]
MADGGVIVARGVMLVALLMLAGLPIYGSTTGRGATVPRRLPLALFLLAAVAIAASAWWALASVAAMMAQPLGDLDRAIVVEVLGATPLGAVLKVRLALLAAVIVIAFVPIGRARLYLAALTGGAALATCAWTGHAGATEGMVGSAHRVADVLHLLAAATWLGALATLLTALLSNATRADLDRRLSGFATTGTVIVGVVIVTGVVNTIAIAGWPIPASLLSSRWAGLLAIKLGLFGVMLALAGINRWRLTPALTAGQASAVVHLRRSLLIETLAGLAIVALVAVIGTLDPAG